MMLPNFVMKVFATVLALIICAALNFQPSPAQAFCGFYVAKADTKLFNNASKVVIVRNGEKTVITMANDYQGDLKEFALVVPVPTVLKREQIHVTKNAIIDHLDAYTAPRLVEYFDRDPCEPLVRNKTAASRRATAPMAPPPPSGAKALGVKIEAQYTVGEYDILILSAKESAGLATWLRQNGYKLPNGAGGVLGGYLAMGTKFFVAKVNLKKKAKLGGSYLRPLQIAFNASKFALPIRLGMLNANGPQELFVLALTRKGRVKTTNYRNVQIPSNRDIPLFVKSDFARFYKAMFDTVVKREDMRAVFLEYAWDMNWCDPCAADPLSRDELRELGVFWLGDPAPRPEDRIRRRTPRRDVFVTRLHVRYDHEHFPDDLIFEETDNRKNFQGRYVLRHPYTGAISCPRGRSYRRSLADRFERESQNLANLTGWQIADIRKRMSVSGQPIELIRDDDPEWWKKVWKPKPKN